jgi:hypothetical protein
MPRPKGSKNNPEHEAGGRRDGAGRPKGEEPKRVWLPLWLGQWLKANPRVIEALRDETFRAKIEEMTGDYS